MTIRFGGSLKTITSAEVTNNKATGVISPVGTGKDGSQVVTGDGSKNLLELLQDSGYLEEILTSALTVDDPPGTRGQEEQGLAFIPQAGTSVEIYLGVQVTCIEQIED